MEAREKAMDMKGWLLTIAGGAFIGTLPQAPGAAQTGDASSIPPAYQYPPPERLPGQSSGYSGSSGIRADSQSSKPAQSLVESRPRPAPMTELAPMSENGITFLCGGVGKDEAIQMKAEAVNYDLMLTFSTRDGSYLADVDVAIRDAHGKALLQVGCGGPIMLVDFPGSSVYRIRAEAGGRTVFRRMQVQAASGQNKTAMLIWP